MMQSGDQVSDFELTDHDGRPRRLSELLAKGTVVLFFYPLASSRGCTQEACHFRDLAAEFTELGAQPVGVSPDAVDKQRTFADSNAFDYPLLSDTGGVVAKELGAWRRFFPLHTKRLTFIIGQDRRIIEVIKGEMKFDHHADAALRVLRERAAAA
jgi:peroxiredoxin Q/BCP